MVERWHKVGPNTGTQGSGVLSQNTKDVIYQSHWTEDRSNEAKRHLLDSTNVGVFQWCIVVGHTLLQNQQQLELATDSIRSWNPLVLHLCLSNRNSIKCLAIEQFALYTVWFLFYWFRCRFENVVWKPRKTTTQTIRIVCINFQFETFTKVNRQIYIFRPRVRGQERASCVVYTSHFKKISIKICLPHGKLSLTIHVWI